MQVNYQVLSLSRDGFEYTAKPVELEEHRNRLVYVNEFDESCSVVLGKISVNFHTNKVVARRYVIESGTGLPELKRALTSTVYARYSLCSELMDSINSGLVERPTLDVRQCMVSVTARGIFYAEKQTTAVYFQDSKQDVYILNKEGDGHKHTLDKSTTIKLRDKVVTFLYTTTYDDVQDILKKDMAKALQPYMDEQTQTVTYPDIMKDDELISNLSSMVNKYGHTKPNPKVTPKDVLNDLCKDTDDAGFKEWLEDFPGDMVYASLKQGETIYSRRLLYEPSDYLIKAVKKIIRGNKDWLNDHCTILKGGPYDTPFTYYSDTYDSSLRLDMLKLQSPEEIEDCKTAVRELLNDDRDANSLIDFYLGQHPEVVGVFNKLKNAEQLTTEEIMSISPTDLRFYFQSEIIYESCKAGVSVYHYSKDVMTSSEDRDISVSFRIGDTTIGAIFPTTTNH